MSESTSPLPHPIESIMKGSRYQAGPFWIARVLSLIATIALLYGFHQFIAPKLGIYDVRLIVLSLLFATLAVSLNLINGITGQFSVGHAAFYLIGAITAGKLSTTFYTPNPGNYNPQVWLVLMIFAGGAAAAIAGLLVGLPSLRLRGDYLAVATLGFGEIVNVFLRNQDGKSQAITLTAVVALIAISIVLYLYILLLKRLPVYKGFKGFAFGMLKLIVALAAMRLAAWGVFAALGPSLDKFGRLDTGGAIGLVGVPKLTQIYFIILLFIGTIAISRNLLKSAHGLSFLAVREDELAADATGVSTTNVKVTAFAIGAAIAGMAGALFAHYNGSVSPDDFKMDVSFMLVAMVVIGGTGSITGAALAGIGLKLLEEGLRKLPQIPAVDLFSLVIAAIVLFAAYRFVSQRGWLKIDGGLKVPLTVLGALACLGVGWLGYLTTKADLSWVLRIGILAVLAGTLIGLLFTKARPAALPRFGLFAACLYVVTLLKVPISSGMHSISGIENLIGKTMYNPSDLRWAVFSIALVFVMILRSQGLLGHHEFSWSFVKSFLGKRELAPA
ncbi:MAG TPA: branched-chain amino acid ABC transporter permease [Fimbriimonadaceae bacterium]|nr:branched-chain amino acid ABC transporter permease [Fimbriimonadaceae bacterium]